jgi:hypothetical protein
MVNADQYINEIETQVNNGTMKEEEIKRKLNYIFIY